MATIKLEAVSQRGPKTCEGRSQAVLDGGSFEFTDATEEELAFWNTLEPEEKREVSRASEHRCFYDILHAVMKEESEKGRKQREEEESLSSVGNPQSPRVPDSPPGPETPDSPPVIQ